jgi:hypothetical protein
MAERKLRHDNAEVQAQSPNLLCGFAEELMVGSNIDQVDTAQNRKHYYPAVPSCGAVHLDIVSPEFINPNIKRAFRQERRSLDFLRENIDSPRNASLLSPLISFVQRKASLLAR